MSPVDEMVKQYIEQHPNYHIIKIENFSSFKKYQIEQVESLVFKIGFHKWTLTLYPNGDESKNAKGYISLYLNLQDTSSMPSNFKYEVSFQGFIFNQFHQTRRCQKAKAVFSESEKYCGFAELISLDEFCDPTKGYLVDDCALFGVKIFRTEDTKGGTAQSFTLVDKLQPNKFSWKIQRLSELDRTSYASEEFVIGDRKWRLRVYPKMSNKGSDMLQVYLKAEGFANNSLKAKTYTRFTFRVLDQINEKHATGTYLNVFNTDIYGSSAFLPIKDLQSPWNCYVVNDTLYMEAEFHVISHSQYL